MSKKLTNYEELLIELVHLITSSNKAEVGLSLKDTKAFLTKPIAAKGGRNCLQCLKEEGRLFVNEVIIFMNEIDS